MEISRLVNGSAYPPVVRHFVAYQFINLFIRIVFFSLLFLFLKFILKWSNHFEIIVENCKIVSFFYLLFVCLAFFQFCKNSFMGTAVFQDLRMQKWPNIGFIRTNRFCFAWVKLRNAHMKLYSRCKIKFYNVLCYIKMVLQIIVWTKKKKLNDCSITVAAYLDKLF